MNIGDYITCKKNYYNIKINTVFTGPSFTDWSGHILGIAVDDKPSILYRLFKTPFFKKYYKYKIQYIDHGGVTINDIFFSKHVMSIYFYSKQEERKLKLSKLKKYER